MTEGVARRARCGESFGEGSPDESSEVGGFCILEDALCQTAKGGDCAVALPSRPGWSTYGYVFTGAVKAVGQQFS